MYKLSFVKPIMEFGKSYPSTDSWVSKLHRQIFNLHMCVVPGLLRRMQLSKAYAFAKFTVQEG
jgi:hypothetical protein